MLRSCRVLVVLVLWPSLAWAQMPNTWTEHANSNFAEWAKTSGVDAEHRLCNPSSGVGAILGAWNSGAYHAGRKQFLVYRTGGHADGCWNGGAAFDPATRTWSRLTTASPNATPMTSANPTDDNFLVKYADGTPAAVHSYGTQVCITSGAATGLCASSGGIYWSRAGKSSPETPFLYDPTQATAATAYTERKLRPGGYGTVMAWNGTRQRAFVAGSAGAYEWEPVADVYTQLFTTTGPGTGTSAAIDEAAGRVYLLFGGGTPGTRLKYVDYATASTTKYQTITTTGGEGLENLAAPGFIVAGRDEANRLRLVGLGKASVSIPNPAGGTVTGERAAIFVLLDDNLCGRGAAVACPWTRITPTNATTNLPPRPFTNGMWNKFFAHGCDLFAIVTSDKQSATQLPPSGDLGNVWSFRPDFSLPGCAPPPPPDTQPPTITLTSPTLLPSGKPQVYSGALPIEGTVTDNVGVTGTTVTLDGEPITGTAIDTTTLPNGSYHTLGVRALDAAGNSAESSVEFLVFNCPVCPPPVTVIAYQLVVTKVGTGDGLVGGDGTYKAGDPVTLLSQPDSTSSSGPWTPAPCADTFAMPAYALTCTKTFTLKPTLYRLTIDIVGQGNATGGGDYEVGAAVTLAATPAQGFTFQGWSPSPCAASFPMPANALTCTATFVPQSSGPLDNVLDRTWTGFPLTVLGQSKHARLAFDSKRGRLVLAGGDGTDGSGNSYTGQNVFALDLAMSTVWQRLHGKCPPSGWVLMAPRPDDVTWGYDPKRDEGYIAPAYYGGGASGCPGVTDVKPPEPATYTAPDGTVKPKPAAGTPEYSEYVASPEYQAYLASPEYAAYVSATEKRAYVFNFDKNTWAVWNGPKPISTPPGATPGYGWGGDLHTHFGVLDPVTDKVYRNTNLCNSGGMQIIPLDGSASECLHFSFTGAPSGSWDPGNDQSAIDVQGRMIYFIARYKRALVKWSIDEKRIVEMLPMPTTWVAPHSDFGGGDFETHLAFDTKNRVLMIPNDNGYGSSSGGLGTLIDATTGQNRGVYFFNVDTKAWEWEPAPTDRVVSGNALGYDPKNNVFVYVGRSVKPVQYWIYRYKAGSGR
jgi:hypothetical protein